MSHRENGSPIVRFQEVTKIYQQRQSLFGKEGKEVVALDRVSFAIKPGEIFSLVGESGSGKTTCGRLLVRLEEPTSGDIRFQDKNPFELKGSDQRGFRKEVQMIFQDPYQSLNPQLTVFQTVVEPLVVQKLGDHSVRVAKVERMFEEVGLKPAQDFLHRFPHQLSGGQRQRVAVARAMVLEPNFIVADEPVSMLDASIQAQLLNTLLDLKEKHALTMLFITHDLATARYLSDRIAVIYRGKIMEEGPTENVIQNPLHPYTKALIDVIPTIQRRKQSQVAACPVESPGQAVTGGCPFAPRCSHCMERCKREEASLKEIEVDHNTACFLYYG